MRAHLPTFHRLVVLGCFAILLAGSTQGYSNGIGGDENGDGDVALAGCTCHNELPDNSVTVILDGLPYHYSADTTYTLTIQLIGGQDRVRIMECRPLSKTVNFCVIEKGEAE